MADNYLENKFEKMKEREAAKAKARQEAYRKRMDAYRKRLALEAAEETSAENRPGQDSVSGTHSGKE